MFSVNICTAVPLFSWKPQNTLVVSSWYPGKYSDRMYVSVSFAASWISSILMAHPNLLVESVFEIFLQYFIIETDLDIIICMLNFCNTQQEGER